MNSLLMNTGYVIYGYTAGIYRVGINIYNGGRESRLFKI
jgi:hypothetical protein